MNVFVLTTGRSGSLTFAEACRHITNYTSGHETRVGLVGADRLAYPADHIEVDNRLAWFPGRLAATYGDEAFYVHLRRDEAATAASFAKRWNKPAMRAWRKGILWDVDPGADRFELALDLVRTMNSNIEHFLGQRSQTMTVDIEAAEPAFREFWERIGAEGDLDAAVAQLAVRHHEGTSRRSTPRRRDRSGPQSPRGGRGKGAGRGGRRRPTSWLARLLPGR